MTDYTRAYEDELDACGDDLEAMLAVLDDIIARHWDGTSAPTQAQYQGGRIRGWLPAWGDLLEVIQRRRKLCLWAEWHPQSFYDKHSQQLSTEVLYMHDLLAKSGLHFEELILRESDEDSSDPLVNAKMVVCSSHAYAARAKLVLRLASGHHHGDLTGEMHHFSKAQSWPREEVVKNSVRLGLALGYSMADVMFYVHQMKHPCPCKTSHAGECFHGQHGE